MLTIWVDADACPKAVKEVLFRASLRTKTHIILVANSFLAIPPSPFIRTIKVEHGFDVADNYIVCHLKAGDLVITADIPLAAEVIAKEARALNPRGELYTPHNIKQTLGVRNMMEQLRSSGLITGGPSSFGMKEKMAFANALDRILAKKL